MARNPVWHRDELILALDLYKSAGLVGPDDPRVQELSKLLNELKLPGKTPDEARFRNPNGVAMKLGNLARFDPSYDGVGLRRGGKAEEYIWKEFTDPKALQAEVHRIEAGQTERTAARAAAEVLESSIASGQGFVTDADVRTCIEAHAMKKATKHFQARGYSVTDVSKDHPYDLECTKRGEVRYVEVKGTQTLGDRVVLTAGEVKFAEAHRSDMVLFILHSIALSEQRGQLVASGGKQKVIEPWTVTDGVLKPLSYQYTPPFA